MPSSYTSNLRFEKMVTGEKRSTWGSILNTQLELIEDACSGWVNVTMGDTAYSLTTNNSAEDEARQVMLNFTEALTANRTLTIPATDKLYILRNATSGGFSIVVSNGTNTVTVANGETCIVLNNGTDATIYKSLNILSSALDGLDGYDTNGIVTQTASNTFTGRTITGTAGEITVTDGDGVAGNPTLSIPTQLSLGTGSASAPTYTFSGDTNTGMYRIAADTIGFATAGVLRGSIIGNYTFNFGNAATTETVRAALGVSRTGDGLTQLDLIGDATYTTYGARLQRSGTADGATSLLHRGTGTLNLWAQEAATIRFITSGAVRCSVSDTAVTPTVPIYSAAGTAAAPAYTFSSDPDIGLYRKTTNQLGFSTAGTIAGYIDASQKWWFSGDIDVTGSVVAANIANTSVLTNDRLPTLWVEFNGTGTVGETAAFNVFSITDSGVGDYTIIIDTDMADANYTVVGTCTGSGTAPAIVNLHAPSVGGTPTSKTVGQFRVQVSVSTGFGFAAADAARVSIVCFGGA